jgi:hypothetical protein
MERLLSSSPSTSGSESVSMNRAKLNFFERVREGGTCHKMVVLHLWWVVY